MFARIFMAFFIIIGLVMVTPFLLWGTKGYKFSFISQKIGQLVSEDNIRVEYGQSYGPNARHKLDIYSPQDASAKSGPIVIYFYGGGWRNGSRETYHFIGAALASRGITTVIPDYRLFPDVKFPEFVNDAAKAYAWVWQNLAKSDNKNRKIILFGHSAGAHISALLSLDQNYIQSIQDNIPLPDGFVGLAGPYAFNPTTWETTRQIFAHVKNADLTRPVTFAKKDAPPSLLFHGKDDRVVKVWNTEQLTTALTQAGAQSRKVELADIGHIGIVLTLARPFRWRAPGVLDEILKFIKTHG